MRRVPHLTRKDVSLAMAGLMPHIIRGMQLDFFVKRGVTQTQFLLLASIRAYGRPSTGSGRPSRAQSRDVRCTIGALSRSLHVSMPTVSGIVERLVRAGYARRVPQADDRRQVVVELTAKGRTFFQDFESVIRRRWEEAFLSLEQDELRAFYDVVTKLRERLQSTAS